MKKRWVFSTIGAAAILSMIIFLIWHVQSDFESEIIAMREEGERYDALRIRSIALNEQNDFDVSIEGEEEVLGFLDNSLGMELERTNLPPSNPLYSLNFYVENTDYRVVVGEEGISVHGHNFNIIGDNLLLKDMRELHEG